MGPLTDLRLPLPPGRTRRILPLPSSSFYFSFGLHCPLPFQLSCLRFTRPCDPHTALLLQWPVVPLSARSRAKYNSLSSCSFVTIDKDVQVTFATQSDLATVTRPSPSSSHLEKRPSAQRNSDFKTTCPPRHSSIGEGSIHNVTVIEFPGNFRFQVCPLSVSLCARMLGTFEKYVNEERRTHCVIKLKGV